MTLKITQHHTADHNWLRDGILAESSRLATPVDIGGPYHLGDPAHIQEHNRTTVALATLADAAGCAVILPPERKLGDTGHEADHLAWEQALAQIQVTDGWNDATGGEVVEYSDSRGFRWRAHTFLGNGTFTVKRGLRQFMVLAVGGGGGGGGYDGQWHGDGGSGGFGVEVATNMTPGEYPVLVGGGGGCGGGETWMNGGDGAPSSVGKVTVAGGPGGLGPGGNKGNYNDGAGNGITSALRNGTAFTYGGGGGANHIGYAGPPNTGHGGGGGHTGRGDVVPSAPGGPGGSGIVVVAYQVAPYNDATGGAESYYTKDGKRYKVHTITDSSTFTVTVSAKPFRMLCVGGGSRGGTPAGGGGGGVVEIPAISIPVGNYPVTIGGQNATTVVDGIQGAAAGGAPIPPGGLGNRGGAGPGGGYGGAGSEPGPNGTAEAGGGGSASDITGSSVIYAGGGGGYAWNSLNGHSSAGGAGGGGRSGGVEIGSRGEDGQFYGAGGGGGQAAGPGNGHSGVVIVSYEVGPA